MSMPVIDGHIHMNDVGGTLTAMCRDKLAAYDAAGYSGVCIVCDTSNTLAGIAKNALAMFFKAFSGWDDFYVMAGLDYFVPGNTVSRDSFRDQAIRLLNMGADGFKMYEGKPNARKMIGNRSLLDSSYDSFFTLVEERQVPIAIHMADPENFWSPDGCTADSFNSGWFFGDSSFASFETIRCEILELMRRYPKMKTVVPQLAFLTDRTELLAEWLERFPELYFDLGPTPEMYRDLEGADSKLRRLIDMYNSRVYFSCTGVCVGGERIRAKAARHMKVLNGCGWSGEILHRIYSENFRHIFGKSAGVNTELCMDYCRSLLSALGKCPAGAEPYEGLKNRISEVLKEFEIMQETAKDTALRTDVRK